MKPSQEEGLSLGYIGLGLMGSNMPPRLLDAGFTVTVWNRTPEKAADSVARGATLARSPAALTDACDIVQLCLLDDQAVESVVFGKDGVAEAGTAGKILVDHSTISAQGTRALARRLYDATGMHWVDAPVTGGTMGGRNGTLVMFAGGSEEDVKRVAPIMSCLSRRFVRMGELGAGQTTKACNQIAVSTIYCIMAEMFTMAKAGGVDVGSLPAALEGGFADSTLLQTLGPRMIAGDFSPVGQIKTMVKDLRILEKMASEQNVPLPMTALAMQLYRFHLKNGFGDLDITSIIKHYER